MKLIVRATFLSITLLLVACSGLRLQPANFAWPVESVLRVYNNGEVADERYSISFNTAGIFYEEFGDSTAYIGADIRLICNNDGFYFLTGEIFKNVYVFIIDEAHQLPDSCSRCFWTARACNRSSLAFCSGV